MTLQIGDLTFKDVLNYTAPSSLSKYLKQWGVKEEKGIFPYELYHRIEQIEAAEVFPTRDQFYSSLKKCTVSDEEYQAAKKLFDYRFNLPYGDRKRFRHMGDYLKHYNLLDTSPLVDAISNSFAAFRRHFGCDPITNLSLPSLAFSAMFNMYPDNYPLSYSTRIPELQQLYRKSIIGGLTTVAHRHINLENDDSPPSSRIAPNGEKYTYCSFWDFNSMYLWSQKQNMPTTPGIEWTKSQTFYNKKVLQPGVSLGQLQWINYLQQSDFALDKGGNRVTIEHAYFRGEKKVGQWFCDGYMEKDGIKFFLEYQGKQFKYLVLPSRVNFVKLPSQNT